MIEIKRKLSEAIFERIADLGVERWDVRFDYTPELKLGDLSLLTPFVVAKKQKRKPLEVTAEILQRLEELPFVERIEAKGPFINLFLNRKQFFDRVYHTRAEIKVTPREGKNLIEHTNINPNKAAHVGHLRNACIGDSYSRLLRRMGEKVEVQNYIDDTGVQVADVLYGLLFLKKIPVEKWGEIERFDHYCWDLYAEVERFFEENPQQTQKRKEILKEIEEGESEIAKAAAVLSRMILDRHLQTMERLGIEYDLLTWESHIIKKGFWKKAFEMLKERNAIRFAEEGQNSGCWVMDVEEGGQLREKVIVRSNGTVTYVGKDIAYQLWKFGLLGEDFLYKIYKTYPSGRVLYTSSVEEGERKDFARADRVYNVIDLRQSYLQKVVREGLRRLGFQKQYENSVHLGYEMVALSRKTAQQMGFEVEEKEAVSISGRKGVGIKADDLLDALEEAAYKEVGERNPQLEEGRKREIARKIAIAALRYYMLKFTNNTVVVFDIEDALSFEGETGPYIQYSMVRMNSIRRKLIEAGRLPKGNPVWRDNQDYWELLHLASRLDEVLEKVRETTELSLLAKYAFNLAQKFNLFYQRYPILHEKDEAERRLRYALMEIVQAKLGIACDILGIPIPEKM